MASNRLSTGAVYTDAATFAATNITTLPYPGQLGQFYQKDGKKYQLVQFKSTTSTLANGSVCMWTDRVNFVVSAKVSDSKRNQVAGVALAAVTAGSYGFIQVRGNHSAVVCTGTFASGDTAIMSATDGTAAVVSAGTASTYYPLGIATAADSASTVAVDLMPPLNGE